MSKETFTPRFTFLKLVQGASHFEGSYDKVRVPPKRLTYLKPDEFYTEFISLEFRCKSNTQWYKVVNPYAIVTNEAELVRLMGFFDRSVIVQGYYAQWVKSGVAFSDKIPPSQLSEYFYHSGE